MLLKVLINFGINTILVWKQFSQGFKVMSNHFVSPKTIFRVPGTNNAKIFSIQMEKQIHWHTYSSSENLEAFFYSFLFITYQVYYTEFSFSFCRSKKKPHRRAKQIKEDISFDPFFSVSSESHKRLYRQSFFLIQKHGKDSWLNNV